MWGFTFGSLSRGSRMTFHLWIHTDGSPPTFSHTLNMQGKSCGPVLLQQARRDDTKILKVPVIKASSGVIALLRAGKTSTLRSVKSCNVLSLSTRFPRAFTHLPGNCAWCVVEPGQRVQVKMSETKKKKKEEGKKNLR